MKNLTTTALALLFILALGCRKEKPEIGGSDPCECETEVNADFDILEWLKPFGPVQKLLTDHILSGGQVTFVPKTKNASSYTWYVGADTYHTEQAGTWFPGEFTGQDIPITLVVRKEPNLRCFPNDDGYDSITKTFHIYHFCETPQFEGTFRVAPKGSTDSLDIIFAFDQTGSDACIGLSVTNFDGEGTYCWGRTHSVTKTWRHIMSNNQAPSDYKTLHIDLAGYPMEMNGLFYIKYYYRPIPFEDYSIIIYKEMFGRKLN